MQRTRGRRGGLIWCHYRCCQRCCDSSVNTATLHRVIIAICCIAVLMVSLLFLHQVPRVLHGVSVQLVPVHVEILLVIICFAFKLAIQITVIIGLMCRRKPVCLSAHVLQWVLAKIKPSKKRVVHNLIYSNPSVTWAQQHTQHIYQVLAKKLLNPPSVNQT